MHNALKLALEEADLKYQTDGEFAVFFYDKRIGSLKLDLIEKVKLLLKLKH